MRLVARYAKDAGKHFEIVTVYENKVEREHIPKSYIRSDFHIAFIPC